MSNSSLKIGISEFLKLVGMSEDDLIGNLIVQELTLTNGLIPCAICGEFKIRTIDGEYADYRGNPFRSCGECDSNFFPYGTSFGNLDAAIQAFVEERLLGEKIKQ